MDLYARTSTIEQKAGLEAQLRDLKAAGVEKVFQEQLSSIDAKRAQLEAAIDYCREGDVLVCTKLDRLARSVADLVTIEARLLDIARAVSKRAPRSPTCRDAGAGGKLRLPRRDPRLTMSNPLPFIIPCLIIVALLLLVSLWLGCSSPFCFNAPTILLGKASFRQPSSSGCSSLRAIRDGA